MTMFIGMKIDEESATIIHNWIKEQTVDGYSVMAKKFIYIPIAYSASKMMDEDYLRSLLLGPIEVPIHLVNPQIRSLGDSGNVSLVFENMWLSERYKFWKGREKRLKSNFVYTPRIPISHSSGYCSPRWLKHLPIRSLTLVEEFSTEFDFKAFHKDVKVSEEKP